MAQQAFYKKHSLKGSLEDTVSKSREKDYALCNKGFLILCPLIKKLFHIIRSTKLQLSTFWINMTKKYGHSVLSEEQIKWIIKHKGKMKNKDIAEVQGIFVRRVQQIYATYRKYGQIPVLKKPRRHKVEVKDEQRKVIIEAYNRTKSCACYLESFIMDKYKMKIQAVLKQEGLAMENSRPYRKRKWIRYERDRSKSL